MTPNNDHIFPFEWRLKDVPANGIEFHGAKVFTTFSCGGGSTMGYKLAGYDVIAANDIDPRMRDVYLLNHHPKHYILAGVGDLIANKLPDDLYGIDILDGSPPCSVFSMTGLRDEAWQKDKVFKEGQAKQKLDDLFFQFVDLAEKLQPKIIVAENVKGMLIGHAKWYTREVVRRLDKLGYTTQVFLFNSARMGVPQKRERVFFISTKKEYKLPKLTMKFDETPIYFKDVSRPGERDYNPISDLYKKYWHSVPQGGSVGKYDAIRKMRMNDVPNTINATKSHYHPIEVRELNWLEETLIGSFPVDYNYGKTRPTYLIGMSVPPVMMSQVAHKIAEQWVKPLKQRGIIK